MTDRVALTVLIIAVLVWSVFAIQGAISFSHGGC